MWYDIFMLFFLRSFHRTIKRVRLIFFYLVLSTSIAMLLFQAACLRLNDPNV